MRILISLIVILNFGVACDLPYEDIGGFKLGCQLEEIKDFLSDQISESHLHQKKIRTITYKVEGFFDTASIEIDENQRIEVVVFQKTYLVNQKNIASQKQLISADFNDFYRTLTNRWGVPSKEDIGLLSKSQRTSDLLFLRNITKQGYTIYDAIESDVVSLVNFRITSGNEDYLRGWRDVSINFILSYAAKDQQSKNLFSPHKNKAVGF